jgi:hypothetical protein
MKQDKLYEIISSFYDFKINRIEKIETDLVIEISLPWSNVIGLKNDFLLIKLLNCSQFECEYYKIISDQLIEAYPGKFIKDSQVVVTSQINEINSLELTINNCTYNYNNSYTFWCKSNSSVELAKLIFTTTEIQFYNKEDNEISIDEFEKWKTIWWQSKFED